MKRIWTTLGSVSYTHLDVYKRQGVDDPEKLDELIHRTPGYSGWQQEYWRAHCCLLYTSRCV